MPNEEKHHAVVVAQQSKTLELARKALGSAGLGPDSGGAILPASPAIPTEVRSVRRGKFFLSHRQQAMHGSIRRPLFEHWGHGVVVGEMQPEENGDWCFGAHNDFDLIPEFIKPSDWPEYERTETGWVRKDGDRRLEAPSNALETLLSWNMQQVKRLK